MKIILVTILALSTLVETTNAAEKNSAKKVNRTIAQATQDYQDIKTISSKEANANCLAMANQLIKTMKMDAAITSLSIEKGHYSPLVGSAGAKISVEIYSGNSEASAISIVLLPNYYGDKGCEFEKAIVSRN